MKDNNAKYLARYAEPASAAPCPLGDNDASIAVLIPVYDEPIAWLERLEALLAYPDSLVCVVTNHANGAPTAIKSSNRAMLSRLHTKLDAARLDLGEGVSIGQAGAGWLCVIDRCSKERELPDKSGGVGAARKIAADVLLRWSAAIRSPWIVSTDADATLPHSLLNKIERYATPASALTLPFRHVPCGEDDIDEATRLYEIHLRLYREGLAAARSPYAFETLGSSLAVHRDAYATARGFPRRQGGEDFYLLNKLAKLGGVERLYGEPVRILSRYSQRAPFGTGPAVSAILRDGHDQFRTYDPRQFTVLGALLDAAHAAVAGDTALDSAFDAAATKAGITPDVSGTAAGLIDTMGLGERLSDAVSRTTGRESALRRFHDYFDGLRTLQWIHGMQDALPDVPWRDASPERLRERPLTTAACCDLLFERAYGDPDPGLFSTANHASMQDRETTSRT